ncbi:ribosomal protein S6 kinase-like 1 [Puma concolor]|uniref:Ribosomal protein S6 kinase-like 1 n=1 Tax=Puma concolor TaxID=9696 RepID=A0A6P6HHA1_PUMCO|nr:ribosomal protein S6 kinase-like 1 [Puma concolor]
MSLVACECPPGPGLEPEPCSRARSQARVYLEQIRSLVAPGAPDVTKRDYLVDAATQIRLALERDVSEDYEAAFNHYQNGVDVLLRGVHVDPNKERREAVKLKITKYLRRAEEIFNCHLQRTLGGGASPGTVQLVQDPVTGGTFVVKSLSRCPVANRERLTIIPHGVPYMTKLLRYFVSEDSIFLHLEHVQGEGAWSHLLSKEHPQQSGLKSGSAPEGDEGFSQLSLSPGPCAHCSLGLLQDRISVGASQGLLTSLPQAPAIIQREAAGSSLQPGPKLSVPGPLRALRRPLAPLPDGDLARKLDARVSAWVHWGAVRVLGPCSFQAKVPATLSRRAHPIQQGAWHVNGEQWSSRAPLLQGGFGHLTVRQARRRGSNLDPEQRKSKWLEDEGRAKLVGNSGDRLQGISDTEACDWWSFGSHELLTSQALSQSHPSGIQPHTQLQLPEWLSRPAASLLTELLQFDPAQRLGAGGGGVNRLKAHPFFSTTQWSKLVG